jgi:hypothetical protein
MDRQRDTLIRLWSLLGSAVGVAKWMLSTGPGGARIAAQLRKVEQWWDAIRPPRH